MMYSTLLQTVLKKGAGLVFIACLAWVDGHAQQRRGSVEVVANPLIAVMQQTRKGMDMAAASDSDAPVDKNNATRTTTMGFRVQIYSGANRSEAYAEQARFKNLYKGIDTYINYEEPNYRVKVGDFRSRSEAQALMQCLRRQFNNVFVFTEEIYVYQ